MKTINFRNPMDIRGHCSKIGHLKLLIMAAYPLWFSDLFKFNNFFLCFKKIISNRFWPEPAALNLHAYISPNFPPRTVSRFEFFNHRRIDRISKIVNSARQFWNLNNSRCRSERCNGLSLPRTMRYIQLMLCFEHPRYGMCILSDHLSLTPLIVFCKKHNVIYFWSMFHHILKENL